MKANEKVTDLGYLIELSKGNEAFVDEMVGIFLTENPIELNMLENAINNLDYPLIKSAAHKMKSTIPFVGIDRHIEKDLTDIEMLSLNQNSIERIRELFARVKEICTKALNELTSAG